MLTEHSPVNVNGHVVHGARAEEVARVLWSPRCQAMEQWGLATLGGKDWLEEGRWENQETELEFKPGLLRAWRCVPMSPAPGRLGRRIAVSWRPACTT